jgi:hypothetical protein
LPEVKFYSILAVSKAAYERDGLDAPQAGNLAYYSNTQAGQVSVFVDDTDDRDAANRPGGALRINNNTPFWLALYKAGSSSAYAVLPPQTRNISVPLQRGKPYSYIPRVFQKLTYNNKVMAFTETPCPDLADTVLVTDENPIHTIIINSSAISIDMAPAVLLTNTTAKAVEVYYRADPPGSSGTGTGKNVFVVPGGGSRALLTGFEAGQAINGLRFKSPPWEADKTVQAGPVMANNQVYLITLTEDGGAMTPSTNENPNPAPASAFLEE